MTIITEKRTVKFTMTREENGETVIDEFDAAWDWCQEFPYLGESGNFHYNDTGLCIMSEKSLQTAIEYWENECADASTDGVAQQLHVEDVGSGHEFIYVSSNMIIRGDGDWYEPFFLTPEEATEHAEEEWRDMPKSEKPRHRVFSGKADVAGITCDSNLHCTWDYGYYDYPGSFDSDHIEEETEDQEEDE